MIIVYKTDNWHSFASQDVIGVCSSFSNAVKICKQQAKKEGSKIDQEQLWNLQNLKQTQGYQGEGEFTLLEVEKNKLI